MFSTNKNIETLEQLFKALQKYFAEEKQFLRLSFAERLIRLIEALLMMIIIILLSFILAIFLGMALAFALSSVIGPVWAFVVSAVVILIIILFIIAFKNTLIERPLVRLVSDILLSGNDM